MEKWRWKKENGGEKKNGEMEEYEGGLRENEVKTREMRKGENGGNKRNTVSRRRRRRDKR